MKSQTSFWEKLLFWALPIPFIGSCFFNCLTFFIDGHSSELLRQGIVLGAQGLAVLVLLWELVQLWRRDKGARSLMLAVLLIPLAFALVMLAALAVRGDRQAALVEAVKNGGYLVGYCAAFLVIALERKLREFLRACRCYTVPMLAMMAYYCVRFYLPSAEYGMTTLGIYNYMSLAYGILVFCLALISDAMLYQEKDSKTFWFDVIAYLFLTISLTLTQCKGPMLCLVFASMLVLVYGMVYRFPKRLCAALFAGTLACMVLFSTLFFPSYGQPNRFVLFLSELTDGESVTMSADDLAQSQDILNKAEPTTEPVEPSTGPVEPTTGPVEPTTEPAEPTKPQLANQQDIISFFTSGQADEALASGTITQTEYDTLYQTFRTINNTSTGGRTALWLSAWEEIKASPLTGHGLYSFQETYKTYPHNLFLEIAADFGVPACILVLLLGLWVFWKLLRKVRNAPYLAVFLLYVFAHLPGRMLSGTLYSGEVFFEYGACLILVWYLYGKPSQKQEGDQLARTI